MKSLPRNARPRSPMSAAGLQRLITESLVRAAALKVRHDVLEAALATGRLVPPDLNIDREHASYWPGGAE
ncbi:MAG: hypothetical protein ACHRXM_26415 [Isosphaerales bacterium]